MKVKLINEKNEGLIKKTLNEILQIVGETPKFLSLAWDFTRLKSEAQLKAEGSDYFPQILVEIEGNFYLLQVENTWGGGINIIFEPSPVRPGELVGDNILNQMFVHPKFTWAEYLKYIISLKVREDLTPIACEAMGVDY